MAEALCQHTVKTEAFWFFPFSSSMYKHLLVKGQSLMFRDHSFLSQKII